MLYLCQIQVARSPRLWKHVGSPFASLVVLDQSGSVSRVRAIGHRWWRDHPKLCKPASASVGHLDQDGGVTFFRADLSEVHHVSFVAQQHHRHLLLLFPSSILSGRLQKKQMQKNEFAKKYYLPELVATTVEHSWSWPCGDTLNNIQYNGNPLQSLSILTRLFLCLETGSDDPVKRYELIIEIDCSILKLDCSIGWSLGNISDKNDPKKLRCDAGKLELL